MNYSTQQSFAEACIELARLRGENYKAYMMELNSNRYEVRYWK